jgi:hypothetical protein
VEIPAGVRLADGRTSTRSWLRGSGVVWLHSWTVTMARIATSSDQAEKAMRWLGFTGMVDSLLDFA